MARIVLYIAVSIDGYIADAEGGISWLEAVDEPGEDYGYESFFNDIDVLLMGRKTYEQILGFGDWPYDNKQTYVFTGHPISSPREDISFVADPPAEIIEKIEQNEDIQRIWLVGGGKLNGSFLAEGLIDEMILSIIPVTLGSGIPLFKGQTADLSSFTLRSTTSYHSGLVQMHYEAVREDDEDEDS